MYFSPVFSCVADAVIVVAEKPGDLQALSREFNDFTRAPVVAFIGEGSHSRGFTQHESFDTEQAEDCVRYLRRELAKVKREIKMSFEMYDTNGDGRLDFKEMKMVSKGFGLPQTRL